LTDLVNVAVAPFLVDLAYARAILADRKIIAVRSAIRIHLTLLTRALGAETPVAWVIDPNAIVAPLTRA
jgi:hypothetical protein